MHFELPETGSASGEMTELVQQVWAEIAGNSGIDLTGFDPSSSLQVRLAWAKGRGLDIGAILARFSSKLQHSTTAQVRDCVRHAASNRMYVPPELVCVDEGVSGRKLRRDGLDRMKLILTHNLAGILLVFKVSRLFRVAYRGFQFFQEDVVESGLRAISISQGIDTNDSKTWKQLMYLHGIMDEMLLTTIADHVRSGIFNLFRGGFVVGALTVGYFAQEVAGARPTNTGRPRKSPVVHKETADLIVQHFQWIREGMPIREGWRRWVKADGPCDPRSTTGRMLYQAYRRMLSNARYTGLWAFGRKRNLWSSKRDYTVQVDQPDTEVVVVQSDELRIVSDELFFAVQQRLAEFKIGRRSHKNRKQPQLWDLVTDCFVCARCSTPEKSARFYHATTRGMHCKHSDLCRCHTVLCREAAVRAVCEKLNELLQQDADLIAQTIERAQQIGRAGDHVQRDELSRAEKRIAILSRKIDDLAEMAGEGTSEDRAGLKAKIRGVQLERATLQAECARLHQAIEGDMATITPERIRDLLLDLTTLLESGASGKLGPDVVYRAADVFRQLVGGRIEVHVLNRSGRKRTVVRGTFVPALLRTVKGQYGSASLEQLNEATTAQVWLRKPPKRDELAERAYQLIDVGGLSYRSAAKVLRAEGHNINSGVVWQIRKRYFEMIGEPVPDLPYNNGKARAARAK